MKNKIVIMFTVGLLSVSHIAFAVDESSNGYQAGNLIGKIFLGVLVFLILKKYVFKK
ncbi:hypothetical protein [Marinicellulosiphila megalodicopiae]|uniref:hypothetical protein n=1 Tax=Marinicellulosiphila megalodicopiae TaxID=2724896 RepID=UPI003BAE41D6